MRDPAHAGQGGAHTKEAWIAGAKGSQGPAAGKHVGSLPRATAICSAPASARLFNWGPARAASPRRAPVGEGLTRPRPSPGPPPLRTRPTQAPRLPAVPTRCAPVIRGFPGAECLKDFDLWDLHLLLVLTY